MKDDLAKQFDMAGMAPNLAETMSVLAAATGFVAPPTISRVIAESQTPSADEGLSLLQCYLDIKNVQIRQALLDLVIGICFAQTKPN